ncbi:MAG: lipoprotein [Pseudomonadota bacterium]
MIRTLLLCALLAACGIKGDPLPVTGSAATAQE